MRAGNLRQTAVALFRAGLAAVEPAGLLARAAPETRLPHPIESYDRIFLVGAGKASLPLARAAVPRFPPAAGCLAVPHGYASLGETEDLPAAVELFEAGHPVPDGSGRRAAARTLALARQAGPGDLLVVLVSGGGSSLWPAFAPGITLADARRAFTLLLEAGCPIDRLNALRKHISLIQGGRLARAAAPATVLALLLSDVPGDAPAVIAGGPAAADPSTFAEAAAVVDDYGLKDAMPPAITAHLRRGAAGREEETIKPGDPDLDRVTTLLLGNNATALAGAAAAARRRGFRVESSAEPVQGEARRRAQHIGPPVDPPGVQLRLGSDAEARGKGALPPAGGAARQKNRQERQQKKVVSHAPFTHLVPFPAPDLPFHPPFLRPTRRF